MLFPELTARIKGFLAELGSEPPRLDLKSYDGVQFDPVNVAWYARNGYNKLYSLLGGGAPSWSGESVSTSSALNHSVVWACNRLISETMGALPAALMQERNGARREVPDHPMDSGMKNAPNEEITAQGFRETLNTHCELGGNAYAQILRRSVTGVAMELNHLCPEQVLPDRERDGAKRLVYVISERNQPDKTYAVTRGKPHDILHLRGLGWDGISGFSVISMGRQSIGSAIAAERNVGRFWANGGRVPYILKADPGKKFANEDAEKEFLKNWQIAYSDPHKAPFLKDVTYEQIGMSMADAQALESREFSVAEICRWFTLSPHLAGDLSHATFSNIEQLFLEFKTMTMSRRVKRWEQEFWRCVLTPEEKAQGLYLRFNLNGLLRGDFLTRMQGFSQALQNGWMNQDEVRALEDMNPLPDGAGEEYHIQLNMQSLPTPNQPATGGQGSLVTLRGRSSKQ